MSTLNPAVLLPLLPPTLLSAMQEVSKKLLLPAQLLLLKATTTMMARAREARKDEETTMTAARARVALEARRALALSLEKDLEKYVAGKFAYLSTISDDLIIAHLTHTVSPL